jgi:hypothetical protein
MIGAGSTKIGPGTMIGRGGTTIIGRGGTGLRGGGIGSTIQPANSNRVNNR